MKINKKGFTMVELLATIVIIGIIGTIGIVSVSNLRKNQRSTFNDRQNRVFIETAKTYFNDNKYLLPQVPWASAEVTLNDLQTANYLSNFKDYDKKAYDSERSAVSVVKTNNGEYKYNGQLYYANDNVPAADSCPNMNGKLNLALKSESKTGDNGLIYIKSSSNNNLDIEVSMNDDSGLGAYTYSIYKAKTLSGSARKKLFETGEPVYFKEGIKQKTANIILNRKDYTDGVYKIAVTLYDRNGCSVVESLDSLVVSTAKPTCEVSTLQNDSGKWIPYNGEWTNKDVKVVAKCKGCDTEQPKEKLYDSDIDTTNASASDSQIVFTDALGNKSKPCGVTTVRIDKTPPTCEVKTMKLDNNKKVIGEYSSSSWSNTTVRVQAKCSETSGSGCSSSDTLYHDYEGIANDNYYTARASAIGELQVHDANTVRVKDKAGNVSQPCPLKTVQIDKKAPSCDGNETSIVQRWLNPSGRGYSWMWGVPAGSNFTGDGAAYNGEWTGGDVRVTKKCLDNDGSGCKNNSKIAVFSAEKGTVIKKSMTDNVEFYDNLDKEGQKTTQLKFEDKAGNTAFCNINKTEIKIDKKPPSCDVSAYIQKKDGSTINYDLYIQNHTDSLVYDDVYVESNCRDTDSGCVSNAGDRFTYKDSIFLDKVAGAEGKFNGGTVEDVAHNTKTCASNKTVNIIKEHLPFAVDVTSSNSRYNSNEIIVKIGTPPVESWRRMKYSSSNTSGESIPGSFIGIKRYCIQADYSYDYGGCYDDSESTGWINGSPSGSSEDLSSGGTSRELTLDSPLDGSNHKLYFIVEYDDGTIDEKEVPYKIYKDCSYPIDNGYNWCGSDIETIGNDCMGTQSYSTLYKGQKDKFTGTTCSNLSLSKGCVSSQPASLTQVASEQIEIGECNNPCGKGKATKRQWYVTLSASNQMCGGYWQNLGDVDCSGKTKKVLFDDEAECKVTGESKCKDGKKKIYQTCYSGYDIMGYGDDDGDGISGYEIYCDSLVDSNPKERNYTEECDDDTKYVYACRKGPYGIYVHNTLSPSCRNTSGNWTTNCTDKALLKYNTRVKVKKSIKSSGGYTFYELADGERTRLGFPSGYIYIKRGCTTEAKNSADCKKACQDHN